MSRWGIGICFGLALLAEGCALQWPQYSLVLAHVAGGLIALPMRIGKADKS